ncbi:hypothetical protein DH2020_023115 [Rehmannia glutinosa]|uniref:WRKY domain-containing protein n=1 Tax=Rehmannia glutinosa TaxID=99300 RepID=A0ABR0W938_REHGL
MKHDSRGLPPSFCRQVPPPRKPPVTTHENEKKKKRKKKMEDDWDLHAVVRGCATTTTTTSSANTAVDSSSRGQLLSTIEKDFDFSDVWFRDLLEEPRRESSVQELHDLYKPFFPNNKPQQIPSSQIVLLNSPQSLLLPISSPHSVLGGLKDLSPDQQQHQVVKQKQQFFSVVNGSKASSTSHFPTPRSKKRKNNLKKVCHVPAESLSSDMWSWRKYGQKPIKGSPYPRGYYKCSTLKGCMARKQVERHRADPGMFIVTYTAEHNHPIPTHRNSLAGSSRGQKPADTPNSDDPKKSSTSPELSPAASLSPAPEKPESSREDLAEADDEEDGISGPNMAVDDDLFAGLEDSDHFPADFQFPWVATTAAGGS